MDSAFRLFSCKGYHYYAYNKTVTTSITASISTRLDDEKKMIPPQAIKMERGQGKGRTKESNSRKPDVSIDDAFEFLKIVLDRKARNWESISQARENTINI